MGCHNFKFPQEGRRRNGGACARWTLHCSKAFLQRMHWGWRGVFRESAFGVACCRRGNLHRGNLVFVPPFRNWEGAQRSHVCFHRAKLAYVSVTSCVAVPQPFLFHFLPFVFELPSCTILLFLSCSIPCDFCCPFFFEGTSVVVHFDAQQKVAQKIVLPSFSFSFSFFLFHFVHGCHLTVVHTKPQRAAASTDSSQRAHLSRPILFSPLPHVLLRFSSFSIYTTSTPFVCPLYTLAVFSRLRCAVGRIIHWPTGHRHVLATTRQKYVPAPLWATARQKYVPTTLRRSFRKRRHNKVKQSCHIPPFFFQTFFFSLSFFSFFFPH